MKNVEIKNNHYEKIYSFNEPKKYSFFKKSNYSIFSFLNSIIIIFLFVDNIINKRKIKDLFNYNSDNIINQNNTKLGIIRN